MTAVQVRALRVEIGGRVVVDGVDFDVAPGECVALVGESGAGKSLTARAMLGLLPDGATPTAEQLRIDGADAAALSETGWRRMRGRRVALVSQDALAALDPLRRIGREVAEPMEVHRLHSGRRSDQIAQLLSAVSLSPHTARRHPHEMSGGMRQRALIASALAAEPAVLIADEPTTALDATVQVRILDLLRSIADAGRAVLFVTHDFAAVRRVADRVLVMHEGRIVEQGPVAAILSQPQHPHTRALVAASSVQPRVLTRPTSSPLLRVSGVSKSFDRPAVIAATFTLHAGRALGIVGESGSGKTTLARMLIGVERPDGGRIEWDGPQRVQLVHQNPLGAFDPRWTVGRSIAEGLQAAGVPRAERAGGVAALLAEVGLDEGLAQRRPHQLSGGQRQRAAIARALAADPQVLVLDEPVSALDATVRERVLALLVRLQAERELTVVFVSHDLAVIAALCDEVLVMRGGEVVEQGAVADVFGDPQHPFTRELLAAAR